MPVPLLKILTGGTAMILNLNRSNSIAEESLKRRVGRRTFKKKGSKGKILFDPQNRYHRGEVLSPLLWERRREGLG